MSVVSGCRVQHVVSYHCRPSSLEQHWEGIWMSGQAVTRRINIRSGNDKVS
jgi:hypothetical protein